jgi:Effector-associated domain 11
MEKKDTDQHSDQSNINNGFINYGPNHGNMANTININEQKPPVHNPQAHAVETAIWKAAAIQLVSEGRTEEALAEILKSMPPEDIQTHVALLAGRISQLKKDGIAGIIDKDTELKELNNIRNGVMTLISIF